MDRFDLLNRMLEFKSKILSADQLKDWHYQKEYECELFKVKKLLKELGRRRNS